MENGSSNWLRDVHITGYKSLYDVRMDPTRVNVIIGEPNTGKSNLLEALSFLGPSYGVWRGFFPWVRARNLNELMSGQDANASFTIHTSIAEAGILKVQEGMEVAYRYFVNKKGDNASEGWYNYSKLLNTGLRADRRTPNYKLGRGKALYPSPVKYYSYEKDISHEELNLELVNFLLPPHGSNFYQLANSLGVEKLLGPLLSDLAFLGYTRYELRPDYRELAFYHLESNESIRLDLMADTLTRMIFYYAAIHTNRESIILLEEPEAHSFPDYVYRLGNWIMEDRGLNQFFIATHSPYLLRAILEKSGPEVTVFLADWNSQHGTRLQPLSKKAMGFILQDVEAAFSNFQNLGDL